MTDAPRVVVVTDALGEASGLMAGVAATAGVLPGDAAIDGLGRKRGGAEGLILGEEETAGVALAVVVAGVGLTFAADGVGLAVAGVGLTFATDGVGLAVAGVGLTLVTDAVGLAVAGVGLALATDGVGLAVAGVGLAIEAEGLAAAEAGVAEAVVVSTGLTNFFEGAFGGGVASALSLVRARSTAERSVPALHPLSMFISTTRSLTRRGLKIFRTSLRRGTETWSSSPLTLAWMSAFRSRRKR